MDNGRCMMDGYNFDTVDLPLFCLRYCCLTVHLCFLARKSDEAVVLRCQGSKGTSSHRQLSGR